MFFYIYLFSHTHTRTPNAIVICAILSFFLLISIIYDIKITISSVYIIIDVQRCIIIVIVEDYRLAAVDINDKYLVYTQVTNKLSVLYVFSFQPA